MPLLLVIAFTYFGPVGDSTWYLATWLYRCQLRTAGALLSFIIISRSSLQFGVVLGYKVYFTVNYICCSPRHLYIQWMQTTVYFSVNYAFEQSLDVPVRCARAALTSLCFRQSSAIHSWYMSYVPAQTMTYKFNQPSGNFSAQGRIPRWSLRLSNSQNCLRTHDM